jgi:hypothetical protein
VIVDNVGYDAAAPFSLRLAPGQHFVYTLGSIVYFTVTAEGIVDYDPTLEGALAGRGTAQLQVNGLAITLDARPLGIAALHLDNLNYDAATPLNPRLLPGLHFVLTPYTTVAQYFTVANDGTLDYDPALEGAFTGRGASRLQVNGRSVTLDARALGVATLFLDNVPTMPRPC